MSDRIHAPELAGALEWFNVPAPLTLADLRGKVVLLDFWTYGCVNCMHVLPDLKRLEQKYGDALVVIGVHSAKFANERDNDNIRRILARYDIDHPVANDAAFRIWRAYGARAWPTQVLIDPEGYVVATASGEGKGEAFDQAIAAVIHVFDEQGKIDRTPLRKSLERERIETATLAFPGKVVADAASGRLVIADSNHHRVLVADLDGRVRDVIGGPGAGRVDGVFEGARFYRPQGLAIDGTSVFVADTENHLIRAADLETRRVTTIAGTGKQAGWGAAGGAALEISLNSPWDLAVRGRLLFVAMAGSHQIWIVDRDRGISIAYAGSAREARVDGSVDDAAFAQPSGLAIAGETMFVADAESNIIRAVALPPTNDVRTIAGGDLFEFGDTDGAGDDVRLQHPLGVAAAPDGRVFIADTYNHKIKVLDVRGRKVSTFAGTGQAGSVDGAAKSARFYEPGGLTVAGDWIYVADTNNHAIRRVRIADGRVETLDVRMP
jgi:thiol-disulfide isomerase/thioredoxin